MTKPSIKENYYIFTGGPGTGKTTTLLALQKKGYTVVEENARRIIKEQNETGGNATHEGDKKAFCELMLASNINDFQQYLHTIDSILFDRGIAGLLGYKDLAADEDWGDLLREIEIAVQRYRYNDKVFVFPPWQEIYSTDEQRAHTFEEAIESYNAVTQAHSDAGYSLIEVPKTTVEKRVEFILDAINSA
jgi:predicted ATPase